MNFVPVASENDVKVSEPTHPHQGKAPCKIANGYFSFTPGEKDKNFDECTAKAFINPARPFMASLSGCDLLIINFEKHNQNEIHSEQAEVEFYSFMTDNKETSLLELEYHSPYKKLEPNESMCTWEKWDIHSFATKPLASEVIEILNKI